MARLTLPKRLDLALTDPDALDPQTLEHAGRTIAGEIGEVVVARLMLLEEDHILLQTELGAQSADPPLPGAPHTRIQIPVPMHQPLELAVR